MEWYIPIIIQFAILFVILIFYHTMEYIISKKFHPNHTTLANCLVTPYSIIAYLISFAEYGVERYFWEYKSNLKSPVIWIGVVLVIIGLIIRFKAMYTAGMSFTHDVAYEKVDEHVLITTGLYKYIRHPGYLGFIIFAPATQFILINPGSAVLFFVVLWFFFKIRIHDEEKALVQFFGNDYVEYKKNTRTWIPFIK